MPKQPCPHMTPPMIAAGFTTCAECEAKPPPGFFEDDTSRQEAALADANRELGDAFEAAAEEATRQAKACRRKQPAPDMDAWRSAARGIDLAENGVDTAVRDLEGAKGEHV